MEHGTVPVLVSYRETATSPLRRFNPNSWTCLVCQLNAM